MFSINPNPTASHFSSKKGHPLSKKNHKSLGAFISTASTQINQSTNPTQPTHQPTNLPTNP